eukprot:2850590-Amphidinium_carterae.1
MFCATQYDGLHHFASSLDLWLGHISDFFNSDSQRPIVPTNNLLDLKSRSAKPLGNYPATSKYKHNKTNAY